MSTFILINWFKQAILTQAIPYLSPIVEDDPRLLRGSDLQGQGSWLISGQSRQGLQYHDMSSIVFGWHIMSKNDNDTKHVMYIRSFLKVCFLQEKTFKQLSLVCQGLLILILRYFCTILRILFNIQVKSCLKFWTFLQYFTYQESFRSDETNSSTGSPFIQVLLQYYL